MKTRVIFLFRIIFLNCFLVEYLDDQNLFIFGFFFWTFSFFHKVPKGQLCNNFPRMQSRIFTFQYPCEERTLLNVIQMMLYNFILLFLCNVKHEMLYWSIIIQVKSPIVSPSPKTPIGCLTLKLAKKLVTCPCPQKITLGKKTAYREGESLAKLLLCKTHEEVGNNKGPQNGFPLLPKTLQCNQVLAKLVSNWVCILGSWEPWACLRRCQAAIAAMPT
jgi:hypothetical protein